MFNLILGLVKDPKFVIDAVSFSSYYGSSINEAVEELLLFNVDMMAEMSSI